MARTAKLTKQILKFILMVTAASVIAVGIFWGTWVIVLSLLLNFDYFRLIVLGTSAFWIAIGGTAWLVRRGIQSN